MNNEPIDRRDYGQLEERVAQLTATVRAHIENVQATQQALSRDIHELQEMMSEAKGGWRTVMLLGGIAASIGSLISWLIANFKSQ